MSQKKTTKKPRKVDPVKSNLPFMDLGNYLSDKYFSDGTLGRVDTAMSPEVQAALSRYQQISDQAFNAPRSQEMLDVLRRYQSALQGYSDPELQAMREQASRGIDSQYATERARSMNSMARNFVRGASATAQLNNLSSERIGQQQQLEQDLFIKGADKKSGALKDYSGFLSGLEQQEFQNRNVALNNYNTALTNSRSDVLEREKYNQAQASKEKAAQYAAMMGAQQIGLANQAQKFNQSMQKRALSRMGGGGATPATFDINGYLAGLNQIFGGTPVAVNTGNQIIPQQRGGGNG